MDNDIKKLTFEQALSELEKIVNQLESGQAPLQQSISLYERGEALKNHCESLLKEAQMKIEKITLNKQGEATGIEEFEQ